MTQPRNKTIPFTQAAYTKMQDDFARLSKERVEVMERLKVAREQGDLSENGAYKYAKFELGSLGRQLRNLSQLLYQGYVQPKQTSSVATFGSTVTISNGKMQTVYMLVTEHESNPMENKLSIVSPIGKALVGKKKGDQVTVEIPNGVVTYTILELS